MKRTCIAAAWFGMAGVGAARQDDGFDAQELLKKKKDPFYKIKTRRKQPAELPYHPA